MVVLSTGLNFTFYIVKYTLYVNTVSPKTGRFADGTQHSSDSKDDGHAQQQLPLRNVFQKSPAMKYVFAVRVTISISSVAEARHRALSFSQGCGLYEVASIAFLNNITFIVTRAGFELT